MAILETKPPEKNQKPFIKIKSEKRSSENMKFGNFKLKEHKCNEVKKNI